MRPPITAIIPSYKQEHQLRRCLAALARQTVPVAPWVHDNSAENVGYTAAVNRGLRAALRERVRGGAEYVLSLNQDCYLEAPDAVERALAFMDRTPRCAIAGVRQLSSRDEDEIIHGGCLEAYPLGRHLTGRRSRGDCATDARMPWVNGACTFVRLDAVVDIGLMDENMFLFGSDSDWCYTARARGWEVWYCAAVECVHEVGASADESPVIEDYRERDMGYFRDKWVGSVLYDRLETEPPRHFGPARVSATQQSTWLSALLGPERSSALGVRLAMFGARLSALGTRRLVAGA